MKLLKYLTIVVLLVGLAACSVNEENFPVNLDEVVNNNGAYMRVLGVESAGFDILDLDNAAYIFTAELFDREDGDLVENVEFFVDFTPAGGSSMDEVGPFKTYSRADFTREGSRNLPRNTFTITIDEVLQATGLQQDDLLIGDRFRIRWAINLTDGRSFSVEDTGPDISGGSFFRSPYIASVNVVAAIPQDQFVGSYTFFQQSSSGSVAGAFAAGWLWNGAQEFSTDISVDPDNTLNGRTFTATPLAEFGVGSQNYFFNVALANEPEDNTITLQSSVGTGLACSALGIAYGSAGDGAGDFNVEDDSEFTLVVRENINGDCGLEPDDISFTVTKN